MVSPVIVSQSPWSYFFSNDINPLAYTPPFESLSTLTSPRALYRRRSTLYERQRWAANSLGFRYSTANDLGYRQGVADAVENFCDLAVTPDAQEGLAAFLEKRSPTWE